MSPGATLVISYIGYETQEIKVGNQSNFSITLKEDNAQLDEVVVIGYGVQKKKLVTGATVQVKGDDIAKLNTTNALAAMQSQTPGVTIVQSSGQAGSGYKVNIRGIGTIGDSAPLYVIDGVAGGDINSLNPSDIESVDVLKDAASAAIYGARAANGVILVTTKQGKAGKMQINYDGYVGWQYLAKKPDVLNAKDWMYAQDLIAFNDGQDLKDWQSMLPADIYSMVQQGWGGTNWLDESYHKGAMIQNHAIGLNGGNDTSTFALGFAYTNQKGVFGGKNQSNYDRYNARLNSDHVLLKAKDFDVIKIGENMSFSHTGNEGIDTGSMYWNNMHDLLVGNPLLLPYDSEGNYMTNAEQAARGYNMGTNLPNPLANADTRSLGLHASKSWNLFLSAYLQIQPIKNLIFKSQFGYRYWNSSYRGMTRKHAIGTDIATQDGASQSLSVGSSISWENTLSYTLQLGLHNINVVVGNTIQKNSYGENLSASGKNNLFESDWKRAWVSNTQNTQLADIAVSGGPQGDWSLASFFGRASYNFNEKYMAQFTLRADGSSNFAPGHRWGYLNVFVQQELAPEIRFIASDAYGKKTWKWNTHSGISAECGDNLFWGNFGADGNWRNEDFGSCGFAWWGVNDAADLTTQLNHSVSGAATGEESNDATMVLNEDGTVKCYDANGSMIRSGSYEIDLSTADGWKKGTFKTTEGATLFPFEINAGGRYVTDFQIFSISDSHMVLTYPDNGAFSGWSEGTYWAFKKK